MSAKNNLVKIVGERIKELRGKTSREKLEEYCDLPSNCIRQIENGPRKTLDIAVLCTLADYFNVDTDFLLGKQDSPRREIADASSVTGLSYEAVEVLKSIDHLENIDLFHALSAFVCSPSFTSLVVSIAKSCTPDNTFIPGYFDFTYSDVTSANVQKYVTLCLEESKNQCQKKMEWYKEVLPVIRVFVGNLADKEKQEGKWYSEERIVKEIVQPIGLDEDGKKLFMDFLTHYRNKEE